MLQVKENPYSDIPDVLFQFFSVKEDNFILSVVCTQHK